jgi:putative DNA primase/helicase
MSGPVTQPATLLTFPITIFPDLSGSTLRLEQHDVASLAARIANTEAEAKERLPLMSGCAFGARLSDRGSLRFSDNVQSIRTVVVEHDGGTVPFTALKARLEMVGVTSLAFTTWRHTEVAPRWRVLLPLSKGYRPEEHIRFVEEANDLLDGVLATESRTLSQGWYLGHQKGAADFQVVYHEGRPLDQLAGLQRRPIEKSSPRGTALGLAGPVGRPRAQSASTGNVIPFAGPPVTQAFNLPPRPAYITGGDLAINQNASANWSSFSFDALTPDQMNRLIEVILQLPGIIAIADYSRADGWLSVLFSLADAWHRGATKAREHALAWSMRSARFKNEADFNRDWHSFRPYRAYGITVGTLIRLACDNGFDLGGWLARVGASGTMAHLGVPPAAGAAATFPVPPGGNGSTGASGGLGMTGVTQAPQSLFGPAWQPPQPLPIRLLPVPPFDPAWLPGLLRPFCVDIAQSLPCPLDYVAVNALTALGGVLGNRLLVEAKVNNSWLEAANFWGLVIGDVAQKKSPAARPFSQLLVRLQARAQQRYDAAMVTWTNAKAAHQALVTQHQSVLNAAAKRAISAGTTTMPAGLPLIPQPPPEPQLRHLFTNDTTYEKLSELCVGNRDGVIVLSDELAGLLAELKREDMRKARQFYLTGWNGTSAYKMDRIVRGTSILERFAITVIGNIQPDPLAQILLQSVDPGQQNDGFAQRFNLLAWPDPVAVRYVDTPCAPGVTQQIYAVFDAFSELDPQAAGAENVAGWEWFIRLGPVALTRFIDWHDNEFVPLCADLTQAASLRAHYAKYARLVLGVALIVHLAGLVQLIPNQPPHDPQGEITRLTPVSLTAVEVAIEIARYAEAHARRAYHASADPAYVTARLLARRIAGGELTGTTRARLIVQRGWSGLKVVKDVFDGLTVLEEYEWVRGRQPQSFKPQGGRPASMEWDVNPLGQGVKLD